MSVVAVPYYTYAYNSNPDLFFTGGDPSGQLAGYNYYDEFGNTLRQTADGGWERQLPGQPIGAGEYAPGGWVATDPNRTLGYDWTPYRNFLMGSLGRGGALGGNDRAFSASGALDPAALDALFSSQYSGRYANYNPYFSPQIAAGLRQVATTLGLKASDADQAALDYATQSFNQLGQPYSEATSPAVVANYIASAIFSKAGQPYQGLTDQQILDYQNNAGYYQNEAKKTDEDSWKRDPFIGGYTAFQAEWAQQIWENALKHPNQLLSGGAGQGGDYFSARTGNDLAKALGYQSNDDPDTFKAQNTFFGSPTGDTYSTASQQGINTDLAGVISFINDAVAKVALTQGINTVVPDATAAAGYAEYGNSAAAAANAGVNAGASNGDMDKALQALLLSFGLSSAGDLGDASGIANAGDTAESFADAYKAYRAYASFQATGNPTGFISTGQKAVGDFDPNAFAGGTSPFSTNDFYSNDSIFGNNNNQAGSNMFDQDGNWVDGEYDQYGNFIPSDQTTFGNDYGAGYGQGNDIMGGGNLEQSNPELFQPDSGGGFSLGGLLGGLGSGISSLFGGGSSGGGGAGNNLLALAPILAAIQYARNQGPFDTSRLTRLSDQYSPDAMTNQYDRNTELQRQQLTGSLADRGVMGSSFGNMDLTNFNTNRELGRGQLMSQAALGGSDIANKILQAQIQERQLRNQMYGSALYSLGNVFGGRRA